MASIESSNTATNLVINKINSKDYLELITLNQVSDTEIYEINYQDQIDDVKQEMPKIRLHIWTETE